MRFLNMKILVKRSNEEESKLLFHHNFSLRYKYLPFFNGLSLTSNPDRFVNITAEGVGGSSNGVSGYHSDHLLQHASAEVR